MFSLTLLSIYLPYLRRLFFLSLSLSHTHTHLQRHHIERYICARKNFEESKNILIALRRSSRTSSVSLAVVSLSAQFEILKSLIKQNEALSHSENSSTSDRRERDRIMREIEERERQTQGDNDDDFPSSSSMTSKNDRKTSFSPSLIYSRWEKIARRLLENNHLTERLQSVRLLAAYVYKMLVITFIEAYSHWCIRDFLVNNFAIFLDSFETLPVSVLVEPLIRQLNIRK